MTLRPENFKSSIIVSVYKDDISLNLILQALKKQSIKSCSTNDFEIIISEDGISPGIRQCVEQYQRTMNNIQHLIQEDAGFRKNIALNRAIKASRSDHLIFIDGDCVPHPGFITAHQAYAKPGLACSGRRLELGEKFSSLLRTNKISMHRLTSRFLYFLNMLPLMLDNAKNIESGIYSKLLQFLTRNNEARLLGCNFSCNKQDLIKINGFNEDYLAAGTGEDSDIDWRLVQYGVQIKKVKFSAIQYHLYHPRSYGISEENIKLLERTKASATYTCQHGLEHLNNARQ